MSEESAMSLHFDVPYKMIFSCLQTRDVLRCMQVCKSWKVMTVMFILYYIKLIINRMYIIIFVVVFSM